jgi:hypothetical protein
MKPLRPEVVKATKPQIDGHSLIRRMAFEALNQTHRDRLQARRLFKQWLKENEDLLEAMAGPAIDRAISAGLREDIQQERSDIARSERSAPRVTSGVPVGPPPEPPRNVCLPVPSAEAQARAAARVVKHSGWLRWPLPVTAKPLGDAKAWEVLDAAHFYQDRRINEGGKERFFKSLWQMLPDRNKHAADQRPVAEHKIKAEVLRSLDERAMLEEKQVVR